MLKRTTEEARRYFLEQGCELLDEYLGCQVVMRYLCKCGREAHATWNNFTKGKRCGYCHSSGRKKKWVIEELQKLYETHGCELLEEEYVSNKVPLRFRCKCGQEDQRLLNEFVKQPRCWDCYIASRSGENHHFWNPDREGLKLKQLFKKKCYKALQSSLKATGQQKWARTADLLGYTPQQLQEHVMRHPNWERVKDKNWHLDHIFPIEAFVEHGITDLQIINALPNIQPILQTENNKKKDKYDVIAFRAWLDEMRLNTV